MAVELGVEASNISGGSGHSARARNGSSHGGKKDA
jgi:hypothetical protein